VNGFTGWTDDESDAAAVALTEPYMPGDTPARRPDVVIRRIPHLAGPKRARARKSMTPLQRPLFPEAV
jgi:hypothetical protein